jgi:hypothetical protein
MRFRVHLLIRTDNAAFDPFIRNISGADADVQKLGPWFSYDQTPRALIFARAAPNITTYAWP